MPVPDSEGQISLMLCESILHILVEEGVISNEKALETIDGVLELARESDKTGQRRSTSYSAVQLIEAIAHTFAATPARTADRRRARVRFVVRARRCARG